MEPSTLTTPHSQPDAPREVLELDPELVQEAPGNRTVDFDSAADAELLASMRVEGQLIPGIVVEDDSGGLTCMAGHRRRAACKELGLKFRAIKLTGPVDRARIIEVKLTENVIRKALPKEEVAADILAYMAIKKCSQEEAGRRFGFSASKTSKLVSPVKRWAPDLLEDLPKVGLDVATKIARLPTHEQQREAINKAIRGPRKMKRDAVGRMVRGMLNEEPRRNRKQRTRLPGGTDMSYSALASFRSDCLLAAKVAKLALRDKQGPDAFPALLAAELAKRDRRAMRGEVRSPVLLPV